MKTFHYSVVFALCSWIFLSLYYIKITPPPVRNHDFDAHLQYSSLIWDQGRLPGPQEGWETWQPPLFYLIASQIAPESPHHVYGVRLFSMICGGMSLLIIAWTLRFFRANFLTITAVLLLIATTPEFFFHFTSYSNDGLASLLGMATVSLTYFLLANKYLGGKFQGWLLLLYAVATTGLYTKYTVAVPVSGVLVWVGVKLINEREFRRRKVLISTALVLSFASLFFWLYFHNYRATSLIFPSNIPYSETILPKIEFKEALLPKFSNLFQWGSPYVDGKTNYLAYFFSSSLFEAFHPGWWLRNNYPLWLTWILFGSRLLILVMSLIFLGNSGNSISAAGLILWASLIQLAFLHFYPIVLLMNFRYIAWTWLPWAILYCNLQRAADLSSNRHFKLSVYALFFLAISLQVGFLFSLT